MKNILFAILVLLYLPAFGQNNIKKTAAVTYTLGPPTYTVSLPSSSEIAVDTSTGKIYQYHRTTSTWLQLGQGIDVISGTIPPAYTPLRNMSKFAINGDNELYYYTGSSWVQINAGSGGTGGHVILEGNTPRAQRDSMEFQSNSSIVLAATNTSTRTVVEATIESNAVGSAEIAAGAVGTSEVTDNTITATDLAVNVVSSVDGVTNDGGDIDLIASGIVTITPNDAANTITIGATEVDGSTTNEVLTISDGTDSEALGGQTLNVTATGIATVDYIPATNTLTVGAVEVDGSTSNELQTISASGAGPTSYNVDLSNSGGSVTLAEGAGIDLTRSVNTITVANTGDLSNTNELQTLSVATNTTTLSNGGGSMTIAGAGINTVSTAGTTITVTGTEVDGSTSNELQTLSVATNTTTLSNGGGSMTIAGAGINTVSTAGTTITVTGTEVDGSTSNELQTISASGAGPTSYNVDLSNSGGSITLSEGAGVDLTRSVNNITISALDASASNELQTLSVATNTTTLSAGGGSMTIAGAGINTVSTAGTTITVTGTEVDGSTSNEVLTISDGTDSESLGGQTLTVTGTGIAVADYVPATNTLTISAVEVDGSITNEGILGVGVGAANTSIITSNTSGANGVTIQVGGINTITESTSSNGGTIVITGTEVDGSTSNELQTLSVATNTTTLSNGGGSMTIAGAGINTVSTAGSTITVTGTEVDGSTTNENLTISDGTDSENLGGQTLTVTATGIATVDYVPATNTLTVGAVEVDGSTSNEIQNLSYTASTGAVGISGGGTGTTIPVMVGATGVAAGERGLVPKPVAGDDVKFLRGDGTWATSTGADNWGSQVVQHGTTLTGSGTSGVPLDVATDGITANEIAADAVGSSEIAADAVGNSELAANAVDSTNVINYGLSVLDLGQHGASTGSVLKWNGTQWAPGSDNTVQAWAENTIGSPTYFPSLSDVIFHNGPVLIKEDTMHHWYHSGGYSNTETGLYIKHNSTSTYQNPAIHIRNYGPGTGGTNQNVQMVTMELDSLPAPSSVPFVMNMNYVDAASAAGDNTVWNMGLNMNKHGASYRAGQPSCLLQFESNYAAATAADQEIWFGFNPTSSGTFRPIYMTANRTDGSGSVTSLSGNTIYFSTGATALDKGVWTSDEFIVKNPTTNGNLFLTLRGNGTGSSVLRMRRPGDGSNYNALSIANSTTYLQLSDSYLDVKVGADIFSMDHANYGNAIISARYNAGSPNDTLDFGHYPGFGENYASHSNYRFTLSDGAAIYFGVYGNTIGNYGALGQTNANDIFLHTGKVITTTEVALGIDRTTGNVGISKIISDIDSDAELQVGGKVQVDDVSGTTTKLSGWTSTSTLTDVVIGGGLSISGDTLRTASGGGGIYGNGIAGSGNGDIPNGGSTATVTGDDPLILNLDAAAGQTNRMLRLVTDYSAEDAITKMLQLVAPTDSLIVISQDQSIVFEYKGPPSDGTSLTISSNQKLTLDATTGTVIKGAGTELSVVGEAILGSGAAAPLVNQVAHASGSITSTGDAQSSEVILRRTITGTSATELFLDGASIQAILPATNRIWTGTAKCSGSVTDVGNGATIVVGDTHARYQTFTVKRVGSSTTLMTAATGLTDTWTDTNMAGAAFTLTADNTTEALKITFTPPTLAGSTTVCKAVCTVNVNELGF